MRISTHDLSKDDMLCFTHGDGSSDLVIIESVEWLDWHVEINGFAMIAGFMVTIPSPFNELVEVWNA